MDNLKVKYQKEVVGQMQKKFGYKNKMAVPAIKKIVINSCYGKTSQEKPQAKEKKYKILLFKI
jgi:ribosomal protein L5